MKEQKNTLAHLLNQGAPVVFCKTEYKILLHDGTHSDIVLPVILFPEMEEVE